MGEADLTMYKTAMLTGETTVRGMQKRLQRCGVQIMLSMRYAIKPDDWNFDLLSPFWRLYRMEAAGAWVECNGRRHKLAPGILHLIPAWVHFTTGTQSELTQNYLHFTVSGFPSSLLRSTFDRPFALPECGVLAGVVTGTPRH